MNASTAESGNYKRGGDACPKRSGYRLLLVEDNPGDTLLTTRAIEDAAPGDFAIRHVALLADAKEALCADLFDVVLLDLGLPDSQGLSTLEQLLAVHPETAVVVLTGASSEELGERALSMGAQDFLSKELVGDQQLLVRALRYAIERQRLSVALDESRRRERREREWRELVLLLESRDTPLSAELYGAKPVSVYSPEMFGELVKEYVEVLTKGVDRQLYRTDYPVTEALEHLAGRFGLIKAKPRDVIEMHTKALEHIESGSSAERFGLIADEGRLMVLELMGHLAGFYRLMSLDRKSVPVHSDVSKQV